MFKSQVSSLFTSYNFNPPPSLGFSPSPPRTSLWGSKIIKLGLILFGLGTVNANFVSVAQAAGPSMSPTINELGAMVFINRWWTRSLTHEYSTLGFPKSLKRGDVVCSKSPIDPSRSNIIKRVVALPGDVIQIPYWPHLWKGFYPPLDPIDFQSQMTFIHHYEPAKEPKTSEDDIYVRVPHGHVWLEGDNADSSRDSRFYGPVPISLLQGKVVAVFNYAEGTSGFHML